MIQSIDTLALGMLDGKWVLFVTTYKPPEQQSNSDDTWQDSCERVHSRQRLVAHVESIPQGPVGITYEGGIRRS